MNKKGLGKYFIRGTELYYATAYIDSPALELINIRTNARKTIVIGSPVSEEYELVEEDIETSLTKALEVAQDRFNRIQKAIEYIEQHFIDDECSINKITGEYTCEGNENFLEDLLDILEGSDND